MDHYLAGYEMGKTFVDKHKFHGHNALDIGAGHCGHTLAFAEKYDLVDAIDIDDCRWDKNKLLSISEDANKITFHKMDAHNINQLNKKYDLIFSLSALEHISNWQEVIKLIASNLNKNGSCYIVICPLYFSPLGHHLRPYIGDWEHILLPQAELFDKINNNIEIKNKEFLLNNYLALNKLTASELLTELDKYFDRQDLELNISKIEYLGRLK